MTQYECDDCLGGILFPPGECPTCGPSSGVSPPEVVQEFRRKLASPDWERLVRAAREHLGFAEYDREAGVRVLWKLLSFPDRNDDFDDAMLGRVPDFAAQPSPDPAAVVAVELGRVAAVLASSLETASVGPIVFHLLCDVPLRAEELTPARRDTPLVEYAAAFHKLIGASLPRRGRSPYRSYRDGYVKGFVQALSEDGVSSWDLRRALWNSINPHQTFDSIEAFRKFVERACKSRFAPD